MALPIPDDWDGETHQTISITVPESAQWRGIVKGAIHELTDLWRWDANTGDPDEAVDIAWSILDSLLGQNESINLFKTDLNGFEFYESTGGGVWTVSHDAAFDGSMKFDASGESVGDKCRARKSVNITIQENHKLLVYFWSITDELFHCRYRLRDENDDVIIQFGTGNHSDDGTDQFLYTWAGNVIKTIEVEAEVIETGGTIHFEYVNVVLV